MVEKVTGGWNPMMDLLLHNSFVALSKFRMKTIVSVLTEIRKGDVMFIIDLKDKYFLKPFYPELIPYLWFMLVKRTLQFKS